MQQRYRRRVSWCHRIRHWVKRVFRKGAETMLHFEAFHGVNANGQMACNQATAKANAWLEKHRSEIVQVISFSASQSGTVSDAEPGVEYILTLMLEVSSAFGKHEHERG